MLEHENKIPNEDITTLLKDLGDIKAIFDLIKVSNEDIDPVVTKGDKIAKIQGKTEISYKDEDIKKLVAKIEDFRNSIIK